MSETCGKGGTTTVKTFKNKNESLKNENIENGNLFPVF